jgi:hypothetical protein
MAKDSFLLYKFIRSNSLKNILLVTLHKLIIKCIHDKQSIDVDILYHEHKVG